MTRAIAAAILLVCLTGCQSGRRIAKANDALRLERESLKERVSAVEAENAELRAKVSELSREQSALPDDTLSALPRIASIELTRSSTIWTEGGASEIRFFLVPKDGLGRFVQAVGTLKLRAVVTGSPSEEPSVLIEQDITPTEIRRAYASGIGGAVYLFQIPVPTPPVSSIALRAEFTDALTGVTYQAERLIEPEQRLQLIADPVMTE